MSNDYFVKRNRVCYNYGRKVGDRMKNKRKKRVIKSKIKIFFIFVFFGSITCMLGYNCLCTVLQIRQLEKEKEELEDKLVVLKEEKEALESDILKLEDPDYIAKYVREKYFYSKEGELILRLD